MASSRRLFPSDEGVQDMNLLVFPLCVEFFLFRCWGYKTSCGAVAVTLVYDLRLQRA